MFFFQHRKKAEMPSSEEALPGRSEALQVTPAHHVLGTRIIPPYPEETQKALFGLGCFWGAERIFWRLPGVFTTAVGYAGGYTANPTYEEVCSGLTGHNEVVLVVFNHREISYENLVRIFFESHDPTQGMRQGNDVGTQYRSGIYVYDQTQRDIATDIRKSYETTLFAHGLGPITTEIMEAPTFYFAEDSHQAYLGKNPGGYCGLGGTGLRCSPEPHASS